MAVCSSLAGAAQSCAALLATLARLGRDLVRSRSALAAENELLRIQLAKYAAREVKPRRLQDHERLRMVLLSRLFEWRKALILVTPATLIRWHRNAWRLFWRIKSRGGRPPVPPEIRALIRKMARENDWGEERIAAELLTKLGLQLSPRTIGKYLPRERPSPGLTGGGGGQRWATFVRNHARAIAACDFCTTVTATFRTLYVFVVMGVGSRRLLHLNVTAHPTAEWTLQQLREALPGEHPYRFLIHDRDSIYSRELDQSIAGLGVKVLRAPKQAPKANTFAKRLIGTLRRECLDYLIPFGERHLRHLLQQWKSYYNQARPHSSLGPGFPVPAPGLPVTPRPDRHRLPAGARVVAHPVLGGVCHDYRLEDAA